MKNLFLAACITAGVSALAVAKAAGPGPAMEARANTLTRALAQRIRFNEGQYVKVRALHLRMLTERRDLEISLSAEDEAARDAALSAAQQRYEDELSELLHPSQRVAYQNLRSNFTAHRLR